MKVDIHVHLADINALQRDARTHYGAPRNRILGAVLRRALVPPAGQETNTDMNGARLAWLAAQARQSGLDRIVLLALDAVYDKDGQSRPAQTVFHVKNDFVCAAAKKDPVFLFGASIHPYRGDACEELDRWVKNGACLVKWIPSAQRIIPDDPACFPFYEALAAHGIPLLSHTGIEHMLGSRRGTLNHPQRLTPALERGVTVIAAHCGAPLFLHERSFFGAWAKLARRYENLYGDTSALAVMTRVPYLRRMIRDPVLRKKLVYGSDFPGVPSPYWCCQLGFKAMGELSRIDNPLERNVRVMRALGTPESVFECADRQLGIGRKVCADAC